MQFLKLVSQANLYFGCRVCYSRRIIFIIRDDEPDIREYSRLKLTFIIGRWLGSILLILYQGTLMKRKEGHLWSHEVKTDWHPPAGFFEETPEKIAAGLKAASSSLKQALDRLDFYINRAGVNLSTQRKQDLERAKALLEDLYRKDEKRNERES